MKVLVIGCGVIGLTTAYYLRGDGHEVKVIDRKGGPGQETSFANGALLTASMSEPWNTPGCWRVLLGSLARPEAALQLHMRVIPALAGWGIEFLRNSSVRTFERNALSNLRLALYSLRVMELLRQETGIEYGRTACGALRLFRNQAAMDCALRAVERLSTEGSSARRLSRKEAVDAEPALGPISHQFTGAIHYGSDETGDAYQYCIALAEHARRRGVEFHYGTEVSTFEVRAGRATAALSEQGRFEADQCIVAAGSYSTPLLRPLGIHLPVQPVKGYSLTLDEREDQPSLRIPVIDDQLHAAIVPLESAIRVAGTAEFAGFDRTLHPVRVQNLLGLLRQVLPEVELNHTSARPWCGLRAMSADGVPIIGRTPISNLLVNTGHGHLGWSMAAGSARLLTDLICGEEPGIDPGAYALARFA
jgi:D-amino-acid dehydrogenase